MPRPRLPLRPRRVADADEFVAAEALGLEGEVVRGQDVAARHRGGVGRVPSSSVSVVRIESQNGVPSGAATNGSPTVSALGGK